MSSRPGGWQLAADSTGAVLQRAGRALDPAALPLSAQLVRALREWGKLAGDLAETAASVEMAAALADRGQRLAVCVADELDCEVVYVDPVSGRTSRVDADEWARAEPAETPWVPGLFVSGVLGVIVATVLVVVTFGLADVHPLLATVVNLAIVAGLAPSVWLGSMVPVWRWLAYGTGAGILVAWVVLLFSLLGG